MGSSLTKGVNRLTQDTRGRILIADDSRFFLQSLERLLQTEGYDVFTAEDGVQAVDIAAATPVDLILLDVEMPRLGGVEACRKIKEDPARAHIPVLFVTSMVSSELRLKCLRAGGEEFLTKPFIPDEILAQVEKFMRRAHTTTGLIEKVQVLETERNDLLKRIADLPSESSLARAFRITPFNTLSILSNIDDRLVEFSRENGQFAIIYLAVDNMDRIDVLFGSEIVFEAHAFLFNKIVEYLRDLAADLNHIRIARNLSDDFVLFLPEELMSNLKLDSAKIRSFAIDMLMHIRNSFESQFLKKEVSPILSLTVGVSWVSATSRLSFSRQILNAVKEASNGAYNYQADARQVMHNRLREMIQSRSVRVVYQPIVRVTDGRIGAYEALARGEFPELMRPQMMFDVAEESKQASALSRLCRERALEILPRLAPDKLLFINFHPEDFLDEELLRAVPEEPIFKVDPSRIVIEMTERSAIREPDKLKDAVEFLKNKGFKIAIDDLGSGYTSLGLIASLNPEYIKFDMSLIRGISISPTKQALLKTLSQFTQEIGATSVAEGIETQEELDVIREFKCDLCQGFFFSKPRDHLITEEEFAFRTRPDNGESGA